MKLTIEDHSGQVILEILASEESGYEISGDRLPRRDPEEGPTAYSTDDGYHVMGLIAGIFGAYDSRGYLTRKLREHQIEQTVNR